MDNTIQQAGRGKKTRKALSFIQIINMSVGFFGIQMGFALQNSNVSRIFQTLGAEIDEIPILWIAAPLTGLIIQPIIGYYSDRTWHKKWGRRRPYFFVGAVLACMALFIMPNSPYLWFAAGMLWIMDASINVSMEPFRAFVGDNLPDRQRTLGFAMQSFFIGLGGYLASKFPVFFEAMGVANTAPEGIIPDTVKYSFYIGGIIFFLAVLWTVLSSNEYSPEELAEFEGEEEFKKEEKTPAWYQDNANRQRMLGIAAMLTGAVMTYIIIAQEWKKELTVVSIFLIGGGGLCLIISAFLQNKGKTKHPLVQIVNDMQAMPKTMKQLAWVQFFSWFAMFALWIYTTPSITSYLFNTTDTSSQAYNEGANMVNSLFANKFLIAAIVAFLLPLVAKASSRRFTHFIALCLGGAGFIYLYINQNVSALHIEWIPAIGIGIAWASILSIPYAMLSSSLPSAKMGYYMGVFNFFIVIPQLVAASILGFIVSKFFDNEPIYALLVGGCSMILAGLLSLRVDDNDVVDVS